MLRKGISKAKLLADLSMMMKRGKIAGKAAIHNLMFHHAAAVSASAATVRRSPVPIKEYEFSCSNSPAFQFPSFHLTKRKHAAPPIDRELLAAAMEMFNSAAASPALPGFGPSPMVRQLRITDSPFPLYNVDDDNHVDEAAEKFIVKFYNDLKRQNSKSGFS
ncbi:hypothetical protein C2S53_007631 [Perilla frutescens var. hirtella]|uniref:Avr9/Cf-9 rapidly elicited protein 146 n=1 Tax=Perilla frutescens var. hirtella TaxID=608512 RepID=A0AAD4INH0_PERFH|nr:hypothetical protein C2S53_007631 [Perilla frutescens var. hirtella]